MIGFREYLSSGAVWFSHWVGLSAASGGGLFTGGLHKAIVIMMGVAMSAG